MVNGFPDGPKSFLPGAAVRALQRDPIGFLTQCARTYGDASHWRFGPQHFFFFNHPDQIRDILVTNARSFMKGRALQRAKIFLGEGLLTSEGELHRRQRRLVLPAFHHERIQHYGEVMVAYGRRAAEQWRDGEELDVHREMMRLTLSIVGKTLFDADVAGEADELGRALTVLMDLFTTLLSPFAGILQRLPLPQTRRFRKAMARLDATIYRIIEERRAAGIDRGDLLSMLLLAQDEEECHPERSEGAGWQGGTMSVPPAPPGPSLTLGMTDLQVRDEAMTLLLAGHETTANALAWTWYHLSRNPEAERGMHDEIARVCGDRIPSPADVARLTFTEMVLAESMRIHPPAYLIGRMALEDVTVGAWRVPKGAIVIVAEIVTHRDARWFPDPMRFDPMRFTGDAKAARPKFAYFPFGGGPRICIGESFAWTEGILLLATIAQQWRFTAGRDVEPLPLITLRPKGGMPMHATRRG